MPMSMVVISIIFVIVVVVIMLFMILVVMIFLMIMIAMIFFMVMIFLMIMIVMFFFMIIAVIINVNLAVKVFCFSPNQSRSNGSFDRKRTAICETPLKDATKHAIDGVVLGITLKVGVKSTMAFDGDDGREIEFTGLERLSTTTMGAMGLGRRNGGERAQQKSQQGKA